MIGKNCNVVNDDTEQIKQKYELISKSSEYQKKISEAENEFHQAQKVIIEKARIKTKEEQEKLTTPKRTIEKIDNMIDENGQLSLERKLNPQNSDKELENILDILSQPQNEKIKSKIKKLHLSKNSLTNIPESISNLSNLQYLNLRRNRLTNIPESISNLSNLQYLNLLGNNLTELPKEIGNLSNLKYLNLSGNKLTDIPESIGKLSNLKVLDLIYNENLKMSEDFFLNLETENHHILDEIMRYCDFSDITNSINGVGEDTDEYPMNTNYRGRMEMIKQKYSDPSKQFQLLSKSGIIGISASGFNMLFDGAYESFGRLAWKNKRKSSFMYNEKWKDLGVTTYKGGMVDGYEALKKISPNKKQRTSFLVNIARRGKFEMFYASIGTEAGKQDVLKSFLDGFDKLDNEQMQIRLETLYEIIQTVSKDVSQMDSFDIEQWGIVIEEVVIEGKRNILKKGFDFLFPKWSKKIDEKNKQEKLEKKDLLKQIDIIKYQILKNIETNIYDQYQKSKENGNTKKQNLLKAYIKMNEDNFMPFSPKRLDNIWFDIENKVNSLNGDTSGDTSGNTDTSNDIEHQKQSQMNNLSLLRNIDLDNKFIKDKGVINSQEIYKVFLESIDDGNGNTNFKTIDKNQKEDIIHKTLDTINNLNEEQKKYLTKVLNILYEELSDQYNKKTTFDNINKEVETINFENLKELTDEELFTENANGNKVHSQIQFTYSNSKDKTAAYRYINKKIKRIAKNDIVSSNLKYNKYFHHYQKTYKNGNILNFIATKPNETGDKDFYEKSKTALLNYIKIYNKKNPNKKIQPQIMGTADHPGNVSKTIDIVKELYNPKNKYDIGKLQFIQNRSCFGVSYNQKLINATGCLSILSAKSLGRQILSDNILENYLKTVKKIAKHGRKENINRKELRTDMLKKYKKSSLIGSLKAYQRPDKNSTAILEYYQALYNRKSIENQK